MSGTMKKPNFFSVAKKRIKLIWKGTPQQGSVVAHPIELYKTLEKGRKMRGGRVGGKKQGKGSSLGKAVRLRLVNGPELNILFLGIPFLVDCAISTGKLESKRKKQKKKKNVRLTQGSKNTSGSRNPLPQAPYSDRFMRLRDQLIGLGMSPAGAELIASGGLGDDPAEDHLNENDLGVLAAWLQVDTEGETEQDEDEMEEVLSEG